MQERRLFIPFPKKDLKEFSWENMAAELRNEAPLFFKFLVTIAAPRRQKNKVKGVDLKSRYPAICTSAGILLKERNAMMSAIQQLVGVIIIVSWRYS